jgi:hypothetical protein
VLAQRDGGKQESLRHFAALKSGSTLRRPAGKSGKETDLRKDQQMKPWSKLQSALYNVMDRTIGVQIHCVVYPMESQYGRTDLSRYWISLDKEIIWDYPKDFAVKDGTKNHVDQKISYYPHQSDVPKISELLREYIDTPKEMLYEKHFETDKWGLINILKAADKRMGKRRLEKLKKKTHNIAALKVIEKRLGAIQRGGTASLRGP